MSALAMWCFLAMSVLVPQSPAVTWYETYRATATDIAEASEAAPLYAGEQGALMTAATLVALAYHESRFDPRAVGDCRKGAARSVETCQSLGLYQVSKAHVQDGQNGDGRGRLALFDSRLASNVALRLLRASMRICRDRPPSERFAWYAAGGAGCAPAGFAKSRRRFDLGVRLLRAYPMPVASDESGAKEAATQEHSTDDESMSDQ